MDVHKLSLNLKDHPEYASALAGASAGDTVTLKEVKVIIDEISSDQMVASLHECGDITVKAGPDKPKGTGEASEEIAAPVLSVMAPGYRKKK